MRSAEQVAVITAHLDALCERRPPVDDRERVSIAELRAGLAGLDDPCAEDADSTHVTASAVVVGPAGVMLHRHKRLGIWIQPGGHIEPGEDPAAGARREVREETGLDAAHYALEPHLVHVDVHPAPRGHRHLDLRYLLWAEGNPAPPEGESQDVRWLAWPDAAAAADGGLAGLFAALRTPTLRAATATDAAAVAEVYLRSYAWAYRDTPVAMAHPPRDVRRWVRDELMTSATVTVAEAAGAVVGFAAATPKWLSHLYVDPAWIGTGIGSRLFDQVRAAQPGGFSLWTFQANSAARGFYERKGLVAAEFGDGAGNEERQPDVRYCWGLEVARAPDR
jgi:8-oxo-dGTP pyrophosphatase MutT (NUDIX family)